jgi:hypothetical protein
MLFLKNDDGLYQFEFPSIKKHYDIHMLYKSLTNGKTKKVKNIQDKMLQHIEQNHLPFTKEDVDYHFDMVRQDFENMTGKLLDQDELVMIYLLSQSETIRKQKFIFDLLKMNEILKVKLYSYKHAAFEEKMPVLYKSVRRHINIFNSRYHDFMNYIYDFEKQQKRYSNLMTELDKTKNIQLNNTFELSFPIPKNMEKQLNDVVEKYKSTNEKKREQSIALMDKTWFEYFFVYYDQHIQDIEKQKESNQKILDTMLDNIKKYYENRASQTVQLTNSNQMLKLEE